MCGELELELVSFVKNLNIILTIALILFFIRVVIGFITGD